MKNGKFWSWVIILSLAGLIGCGGLVGLSVWATKVLDDDKGLSFTDAVTIVRVEGEIVSGARPPAGPFGGSNPDVAYSQTVIEYLKWANADETVKAVVLYVDSPGGSVFASDEIYLQIKQMNKPIITSMGSLATSGGYYISAPTAEIWASPHTLTCSIGVIMQLLNVETFAKEYGVTTVVIKSGPFKDIGNPFREVSAADRVILQDLIDEAYGSFVKIVAEGRKLPEDKVRAIADGRICSGRQAQQMGLVDRLGSLTDAINRAAELGHIKGVPRLVEYDQRNDFWGGFGAMFYRPSPIQELRDVLHINASSPLMYMYIGP